jgi:hypothetical protein
MAHRPRGASRVLTRRPWQALGLRRAQQAFGLPHDDAVALTTGRFQPRTVQHVDEATVIPDEAPLLELARHFRDTGPSDAQHHREKFLRQRKLGASHTVLRLQEPVGTPLHDPVHAITDRMLAELRAPDLV